MPLGTRSSANSIDRLPLGACIVRIDAIGQNRIALIHITIVDGHEDSLLLPNQYHLLLGSRNCCVEQIPPQHNVMLFQDGNNHDWELRALTFVDTDIFPI